MDFTKRPQDGASINHIRKNEISYIDGSTLLRPQSLPKKFLIPAALIVMLALVIGGFFGYKTVDEILHGNDKRMAAIEANVQREVSLDLPSVLKVFKTPDSKLYQTFTDQGFVMYDSAVYDSSLSDSEAPQEEPTGVDMIKLPADAELEDAALIYSKGLGGADALTATFYYNGAWRVITDNASHSATLKYIDFVSQSPQEVIAAAKVSQGWENGKKFKVSESGVDSVGNTYETGVFKSGGKKYEWRVSTCLVSEAFDIKDFPENAHYVGIRITQL